MGLEFSRQWNTVVDQSRPPAWAQWFAGGKLSIARNCVHRWAARRPDVPAAIDIDERGDRLVRLLMSQDTPPSVPTLETLVTTGEPWNPGPYRWLYETVGQSPVPIINISGGAEVGGCFLAPTPAVPIKACSVGGAVPGNSVGVLDYDGNSLIGTGRVGELVSRSPFPGIRRGFVGEPGRYIETYRTRDPGIWCHGDWASVDGDGSWFLDGRSDDTINVTGKRIDRLDSSPWLSIRRS